MTFEADLRNHLIGDANIRAALEDAAANEIRLYPLQRPQGQKNLRAIVYTQVNAQPAANLDEGDFASAAGTLENIRTQFDIYGANYDDARALAQLVRGRMGQVSSDKSIRAVLILAQSEIDPETRENREILDYSVWHSPQ
jgi:hypothetical protein